MTEKGIMQWIKQNLVGLMPVHPLFTAELLAAMTMREVGFLIARNAGKPFPEVCELMRGDYGKREHDAQPKYHGFGFMQIDIDSYYEFVRSGDWKDPGKTYIKAISILEEKQAYIQQNSKSQGEELLKGIVAAYNSGQKNSVKDLADGHVDDTYTYQHDYVKMVWKYREIFRNV